MYWKLCLHPNVRDREQPNIEKPEVLGLRVGVEGNQRGNENFDNSEVYQELYQASQIGLHYRSPGRM